VDEVAMFSILLVVSAVSDACNIFCDLKEACDTITDAALHVRCLSVAEIPSPVGYAGYKAPGYQPFSSFLVSSRTLDSSIACTPLPARASQVAHPEFDTACPMFSYGTDTPHCCFLPPPGPPDMASYQASFLDYFDNWWNAKIQFRIFPRCMKLLRFLPCAVCHPNISDMLFYIDRFSAPPKRSIRLCRDFARRVYKECRRAVYDKNTKYFVVPRDFGEDDFLKIVGQAEVEEGDWDEHLDVPGQTCIDLSEWDESAAGTVRLSNVLPFAIGVACVMAVI
jgi:hypothetical protein